MDIELSRNAPAARAAETGTGPEPLLNPTSLSDLLAPGEFRASAPLAHVLGPEAAKRPAKDEEEEDEDEDEDEDDDFDDPDEEDDDYDDDDEFEDDDE